MSDFWTEDQPLSEMSALGSAAKQYVELTESIEKMTAEKKKLGEFLTSHFNEEFGVQTKEADGYTITLETGEKWEWDSDILEQLFTSSDALPDYVKKRLTVDKKMYGRLDEDKQRYLLPALTRKLGAQKLTVTNG